MLENYSVGLAINKATQLWQADSKEQSLEILKQHLTLFPENPELSKLFHEYDRIYLSREKAAEMIKENFDTIETRVLNIGNPIHWNLHNNWGYKSYEHAKNNGLINYNKKPWAISLTEKGKEFVVGKLNHYDWPFSSETYVNVIAAKRQFVAINGIMKANNPYGPQIAEVEYTWKYVDINPFGWKRYDEKNHSSTDTFVLYDDGWRIQK